MTQLPRPTELGAEAPGLPTSTADDAPPRAPAPASPPTLGGADPVKGPQPGNTSLFQGAPPADPRAKRDRELLLGTGRGRLRHDDIARIMADGDPTGLEHVDMGAINGKPAIAWTDENGRRQVMSVSGSHWMALAKGRAKFRSRTVAMAQAMQAKDAKRAELTPVAEKLIGSLDLAGDPAIREGLMALFRENPEQGVGALTELRMAEKSDREGAEKKAQQIAMQHAQQRGEMGRRALANTVEQSIARRQGELEMLLQGAADPSSPDPTGQIAAVRRDVAVAQSALTNLLAFAPVGEQMTASSPMAVGGHVVADYLIELMATGVAGRRLDPMHPMMPGAGLRLTEMVGEAARLSRMLGYTGEFTPADTNAIEARAMVRAGATPDQVDRYDDKRGGARGRYDHAAATFEGGPGEGDRQAAEAGVGAVRRDAAAKRQELEAEQSQAAAKQRREEQEADMARRKSIMEMIQFVRESAPANESRKDRERREEVVRGLMDEMTGGATPDA